MKIRISWQSRLRKRKPFLWEETQGETSFSSFCSISGITSSALFMPPSWLALTEDRRWGWGGGRLYLEPPFQDGLTVSSLPLVNFPSCSPSLWEAWIRDPVTFDLDPQIQTRGPVAWSQINESPQSHMMSSCVRQHPHPMSDGAINDFDDYIKKKRKRAILVSYKLNIGLSLRWLGQFFNSGHLRYCRKKSNRLC